MSVTDTIRQTISTIGTQAFGLMMPRLNRKWLNTAASPIDESHIIYSRENMLLTGTVNWLAPFGGFIRQLASPEYPLPVNLLRPDGAAETTGSALILPPQAYLRLRRLYANLLEDATDHNPRRAAGESIRPVPRYFHFSTAIGTGDGQVDPGSDLGVSGAMRIYDERGYPIDPLAVASALLAITNAHEVLRADAPPVDQLTDLVGLSTGNSFHVRLVQTDGSPYGGDHFSDSLAVDGGALDAAGLFSVGAYTGSATNVLREIKRNDATDASGSFPPKQARQLLLAPATYGRLSDTVLVPALPAGMALQHDFLTLEVVNLEEQLLGTPDPDFNATKIEPRPTLRMHDHLQLLSSGNAVLGGISETFSGSPNSTFLVGETIKTGFVLPADLSAVTWPAWPPLPASVTADEPESLPGKLKEEMTANATAAFIDDPDQTINVDVLLTLRGLPLGSAVRVYNRKLRRDFVEERGAGAGATVIGQDASLTGTTFNGIVQLRLTDPLGLVTALGTTAPVDPVLNIDVVLLTRAGVKRVYGNLELRFAPTAVSDLLAPVNNGLTANINHRGIAHAGLIGLPGASVDLSGDILEAVLKMTGEGSDPGRDAPRLPLMRRRSLIAAARHGNKWKGVLSAGAVSGDLIGHDSRSGSPGSPGGRDLRGTGLYTQNGRLGYDLARAALRRTHAIYTRIDDLLDDEWNEPAEPTPLATDAMQSDDAGPFAAALLHTVSKTSETPELSLLETVVSNNISDIPTDLDGLITWLETHINSLDLSSLGTKVNEQVDKLKKDLIKRVKDELQGSSLNETKTERLHNEIIRELSAACYGRRDSLWALERGIKTAREFIYLETPALAPIDYGSGDGDYTRDLLKMIQTRMAEAPALKLIVCTPKEPFYGHKYGEFKRQELHERFRLFVSVPDGGGDVTTPVLHDDRTVVFHPLSFPGRPAGIQNQTIIIDDNWMLSGATTMRRRGLTFDEGHDIVLTGLDRLRGHSPQIRAYRTELLCHHLNLERSNKTTLSGSNFTRVADGREAFNAVREVLRAGGYGLVERLYSGVNPHVAYSEPAISPEVYNPEGQAYQSVVATLVAWLSSVGTGDGQLFHDL